MDKKYTTALRDKIARSVATWVFTHIATEKYKNWITSIKNIGLTSIENDLYPTVPGSTVYELPKVSRVTVVVRKRDFEQYNLENVELHFQDQGRTIKIFADER